MLPQVIYGILCLLVGLLAINKSGGFLLYFILSLVLTPLVGIFIMLMTRMPVPELRAAQMPKAKLDSTK